jgi:hypothetical protein
MTFSSGWVAVAVGGAVGTGLGFGLVMGAFVARALRRYMRDEGLGERDPGPRRRDDP